MSKRVSAYGRCGRRASRLLSTLGIVAAAFGCDSGTLTTVLPPWDAAVAPPGPQDSGTDAAVPTPPPVEGDAGDAGDAGNADTDSGPSACQRTEQEFTAWVASHLSCSVDTDCRVIYDCGPHGDSFPVNSSGWDEAADLYENRCGGWGWDGFERYAPRCREQRCVLGEQLQCCGCGPFDAGVDAN
jgi:hypothetical protein